MVAVCAASISRKFGGANCGIGLWFEVVVFGVCSSEA